jgi:serine/threonine-protein kinase
MENQEQQMQFRKPVHLVRAFPEGMTEPQVRKMAQELARSLVQFAKRGIVHQAVKPHNVFAAPDGSFWLGAPLSADEAKMPCGGDLSCMCPEMYWGMQFDGRADVYALGLLLYTMLNGCCLPLCEKDAPIEDLKNACLHRLEGAELPPPKNGSKELHELVLRACAYERNQRFATMEELLEAFGG